MIARPECYSLKQSNDQIGSLTLASDEMTEN